MGEGSMCLFGHSDLKVLQAITTAGGSMCHQKRAKYLNDEEVKRGTDGGTQN